MHICCVIKLDADTAKESGPFIYGVFVPAYVFYFYKGLRVLKIGLLFSYEISHFRGLIVCLAMLLLHELRTFVKLNYLEQAHLYL